MREVLTATDVRARLFETLEPLTRGVAAEYGQDVAEGLQLYLRPFPLRGETPGTRVFLVVEESESTTRGLSRGLAADMPNRAALEAAVQDVLAIALAALGTEGAEDAVLAAQTHVAQLLILARPADGSVKVLSVPKRGRPLVLGALVDEPQTLH